MTGMSARKKSYEWKSGLNSFVLSSDGLAFTISFVSGEDKPFEPKTDFIMFEGLPPQSGYDPNGIWFGNGFQVEGTDGDVAVLNVGRVKKYSYQAHRRVIGRAAGGGRSPGRSRVSPRGDSEPPPYPGEPTSVTFTVRGGQDFSRKERDANIKLAEERAGKQHHALLCSFAPHFKFVDSNCGVL